MVFFHGYSLAHTIRPLVIGRSLARRGYEVEFAGRGPHVDRIGCEGFHVTDVVTMPQERMDRFVADGNYGYYDADWIDRCVQSERVLIQTAKPDLVLHDMKPTAKLAASLEGVDLAEIVQGYGQPGYADAIELMGGLGTDMGPFSDYLDGRRADVKEQKVMRLIADIPEFHPTAAPANGYHYVGPLLDTEKEPASLDLLDSEWDVTLPLVYVTCGSSGREPDYIADLIRAAKGRPMRLFITTAGRWNGRVDAENVRVETFLPGEWILKRAQVMVGIVGIGAIYQALEQGVPVIGAPEHLDQEYHLNRIESLGLGLKIHRSVFNADNILRAIEGVLGEVDEYRNHCRRFSDNVRRWNGGEAVADLVDAHFLSRKHDYRFDRSHQMSEAEFLRYLDLTTPTAISEEGLRNLLVDARARGIPHQRRAGELYYDRLDSWNWLYDREPRFFSADYWALEEKRRLAFSIGRSRVELRRNARRYRARYSLVVYLDSLTPAQRARVFLPYPIPSRFQTELNFVACDPAEMQESLAPSLGYFYGHDTAIAAVDEPMEFTYTCDLTVIEQSPLTPADGFSHQPLSDTERDRHLKLDPALKASAELYRFQQELGSEGLEDETGMARARAIYRFLCKNKRFRKTKERSQSLSNSTLAVLRNRGGHCITMSRAFIALCRAEGIPSREKTGALIGYPVGGSNFAMATYCEPLFGHTWAEVFVEGVGWVPAEFHGTVIGRGAMTADNVDDPDVTLHARCRREGVPVARVMS